VKWRNERVSLRTRGGVTIATPPNLHAEVAKLFLSKGIDVICEKSMTRTLDEAIELKKVINDYQDRLFMVTYCYTGYPMVREARALVRHGAIGAVRQIECDFPSGPFMTENPDRNKRHWRFRAEFMGKEAIFGELGAHTISMAQFVSGKTPSSGGERRTTTLIFSCGIPTAYLVGCSSRSLRPATITASHSAFTAL
jgi:predicted dehydrogenase